MPKYEVHDRTQKILGTIEADDLAAACVLADETFSQERVATTPEGLTVILIPVRARRS